MNFKKYVKIGVYALSTILLIVGVAILGPVAGIYSALYVSAMLLAFFTGRLSMSTTQLCSCPPTKKVEGVITTYPLNPTKIQEVPKESEESTSNKEDKPRYRTRNKASKSTKV